MPIRVLITGGAGYIGSTLLRKLYYQPIVFDNLMYDQGALVYDTFRSKSVKFYRQNILDWSDDLKREIEQANVIIPLAAFVGAPLCERYPTLSAATNYEWFEKLLPYLNKQLVIYPNTNSSYGTVDGICTEETPVNPLSHYAKTKQKAEEFLLKNYPNSIVFRLATVFGWSPKPRLDLLINSLTFEALSTRKIVVFDGHFNRNYIHVEDIANAFNFAIWNAERMKGNVYNLGNDMINMSKLELANKIAELTGATVEIRNDRTDPDKRSYNVSSAKLYSLGYSTRMSLETGVEQLIKLHPFITDYKQKFLRNY